MKNSSHRLFLIMLLIVLIPNYIFAKDLVVKAPPESLSKLYPPKSEKPKWIQQMHQLSSNFGGVFTNMKEGDWANAEKRASNLVKVYEETSKLVPEWKDYFDVDAVKKFAEAVKSHDPKVIGPAAGPVAKTCGKCHSEQYVAVWTRFHWPPVSDIKITDPVTEKEFEYGKYMFQITGAFNGVTVNFGEGQYQQAAKSLRSFEMRYKELKSTCSKCHTTDAVKQFFVNEEVMGAFGNLKKILATEKPNPGEFWKNIGTIGKQGCKKCHLTHRTYAIIQGVWETE